MVILRSLLDSAAYSVLSNLKQLKGIGLLPRILVYKLVKMCYMEPKKNLALREIIKNWPYETFSGKELDILLTVQDVIMIAMLIHIGETGKAKVFDLTSKLFYKTENDLTTKAFINVACGKSVSSVEYCANRAMSYSEAARQAAAALSVPFTDCLNQRVKCFTEATDSPSCSNTQYDFLQERMFSEPCTPCKVYMDLQVSDDNYADLKAVLEKQKQMIDDECSPLKFKVMMCPVSLKALYLNVKKIVSILDLLDDKFLTYLDLEYCCLLQGSRLSYISKHTKRFRNLEWINLAYNMMSQGAELFVIKWLQGLHCLKYLNFSYNRTGDSALAQILSSGICSSSMEVLILTGVGLGRESLMAIANNEDLCHLKVLKLSQNMQLPQLMHELCLVLQKNQRTILEVDLSCCGFTLTDIISLCPVLCCLSHLKVLNIWENRGLGNESIRLNVLPLLSPLKNLHCLPPVM